MSIKLSSDAFRDGQAIPVRYAREGENVSPPLRWEGLPAGTKELALVVEDPDAPRAEPFVHWVIYKIRPEAGGLPEGVDRHTPPKVKAAEAQGVNDYKNIGWDGPAPPPKHGTHHYHFRLYALDRPLEVEGKLDVKALVATMAGHVLDTGELVGTYEVR